MNSQLYHVAAADWPEMPAFLIPTFNVLVALAAVLRFLRGYIGFEQLVNETLATPPRPSSEFSRDTLLTTWIRAFC